MNPIDLIATSERYAREKAAVDSLKRAYHISPLGEKEIAIQVAILPLIPQLSALAMLLGFHLKKSFVLWMFPPDFFTQRTTSPYLAPSIGPRERIEAAIAAIHGFVEREKGKEEREKEEEEETLDEEADILVKGLEKLRTMYVLTDFVLSNLYSLLHSR